MIRILRIVARVLVVLAPPLLAGFLTLYVRTRGAASPARTMRLAPVTA